MFKNIKTNVVNAFRIVKSYSSAIFILTTETSRFKISSEIIKFKIFTLCRLEGFMKAGSQFTL